MDVRDRLEVVIRSTNHNSSSFADAIGMNRSTLSHILNGRNKPSLEFLERVITTFPKVDAHWLVTGKHLPKELNKPEVENTSVVASASAAMEGSLTEGKNMKSIQRIVIFYSDGTFKEYLQA